MSFCNKVWEKCHLSNNSSRRAAYKHSQYLGSRKDYGLVKNALEMRSWRRCVPAAVLKDEEATALASRSEKARFKVWSSASQGWTAEQSPE